MPRELLNSAARAATVLRKLGGGLLWFPVSYMIVHIASNHVWVVAVICALTLGGSLYLLTTRFTIEGRKEFAKGLSVDWPGTTALLMLLVAICTAGFATLSIVFYELGAGDIKGTDPTGGGLADAAYSSYLWHFADAIPLLDIPKTLNWKLKHPFTDTFQGSLTLVYMLVIALPLVYAGTQVVSRWTSETRAGVESDQR